MIFFGCMLHIMHNLPVISGLILHLQCMIYQLSVVLYFHLQSFMNEAGPRSAISSTIVSLILGSIPSLATYFRFSFHFFKKGSCQLLVKVCARSTG